MKIKLKTELVHDQIKFKMCLRFTTRTGRTVYSTIDYVSDHVMFNDLHMLMYLLYNQHSEIMSDPNKVEDFVSGYNGMNEYMSPSGRRHRIRKILKLYEGIVLNDFTVKSYTSDKESLVIVMVKNFNQWRESKHFNVDHMPLYANLHVNDVSFGDFIP